MNFHGKTGLQQVYFPVLFLPNCGTLVSFTLGFNTLSELEDFQLFVYLFIGAAFFFK